MQKQKLIQIAKPFKLIFTDRGSVFGKDINDRLIYVKLKIRDQQKQIVCVSFHYAKDKMQYPYA